MVSVITVGLEQVGPIPAVRSFADCCTMPPARYFGHRGYTFMTVTLLHRYSRDNFSCTAFAVHTLAGCLYKLADL